MPDDPLKRARQKAAERILEDERLYSHLTDDEARWLVDWAMEQLDTPLPKVRNQNQAEALIELRSLRVRQIVRDTGPKSQVSVEVLRDNKPIALTLNLSSTPKEPDDAQKVESPQFGMVVREITFMDALGLRIGLETMGVLVAYVQQGSWASLGGLRPNDVIQRIEETRIRTIGDFEKAIRHIEKEKKGGVIPVLVRRGNETVFVRIEPDWR